MIADRCPATLNGNVSFNAMARLLQVGVAAFGCISAAPQARAEVRP